MITPTYTKPHHVDGSPHRFYEFENGNTASLIRFIQGDDYATGIESYGAREGLYEICTITPNGDYVDMVGFLDEDGVMREQERRQAEPAGMVYEY